MTMQAAVPFSEIHAQRPDFARLQGLYEDLGSRFAGAQTADQALVVVREWDALRREAETWSALTRLHFQQDSGDTAYRAEREALDELDPKLTGLDAGMKRRLVESSMRADLESAVGRHVFEKWEIDLSAFDPSIEGELVSEGRLTSEYTAIIASAEIAFDGKTLNLAGLEPYLKAADRNVRHAAQTARWMFYEAHAAELDRIYDELVHLRHAMARKLGFENFIGLAYKRLTRLDYDREDVARYRDEIVKEIVPLADAVVRARAARLGLAQAMFWDESLHDRLGNPRPLAGHDWMLEQGAAAFHALAPALGEFFDMMVDGEFLDLKNRPGKAGGGFCTSFATYGRPFIFANFNGSEHDVVVLLHEMGHAFQNYSSRDITPIDNIWPTHETAEIHSMSMEFLSFGQMERFFGDDAQRFRDHHLAEALLFLPYGVAVDHFQHLVYERPDATPQERHAMWQEMERRYLPWRRYGDLAFPEKGALWQEKRHIYVYPFYYIDYTLAECCALQFWARAAKDPAGALRDYLALCAKGGSAPFRTLVAEANLRSPFEKGALADVAAQAKRALSL